MGRFGRVLAAAVLAAGIGAAGASPALVPLALIPLALAPPALAQPVHARPVPVQPDRVGEFDGCYVGAEPCGGPSRMAALIARCAKDPGACGWLEARRVATGAGRATPAPVAAAAPPATAPPAAAPAAARGAGVAPSDGIPAGLAGSGAPGPWAGATEARIARLLRALPLPEAVLELTDRLPADPASVQRALGLRRPEGGRVVDLRDSPAPPTVAEILRALRGAGG